MFISNSSQHLISVIVSTDRILLISLNDLISIICFSVPTVCGNHIESLFNPSFITELDLINMETYVLFLEK